MISSPIGWIGGKRLLRKKIIPLIPEHKCYVEGFGGAGWVLFGKEPSKIEVYNDLDGDLVNLFRVMRDRPGEFIYSFKFWLRSREDFKALIESDPREMEPVERARRFFFIIKNSFASFAPTKAVYGTSASNTRRGVNLKTMIDTVERAWWRLQTVTIECLDIHKLINVYDRETTFFYFDPPYYNCPYYTHNFWHDDFVRLAERLKKLEGSFILSINDLPETRAIFGRFEMQDVMVTYTAANSRNTGGKRRKFGELLVRNF